MRATIVSQTNQADRSPCCWLLPHIAVWSGSSSRGDASVIVIHIGSQKTGTTALQGFLKSNDTELADLGVRYLKAGRSNIAHNSLLRPLLKGRAQVQVAKIRDEITASPDDTHILSSEMFFQPAAAPVLAEALEGLKHEVRVVGYVRRTDLFAEAMYKQKVKNGRIPPDPMAFLESWRANLAYMPVINAFRDAFGIASLRIRPFRRSLFPNADVIDDFGAALGVDFSSIPRAAMPSNKTLSRAVSEQLGRVNKYTSLNTRVMIREIAAANAPDTIRSGDVFPLATRQEIVRRSEGDLLELAGLCFPDLEDPFDTSDLAPDAADSYPDFEESLRLERAASDAVMAAVGRQVSRGH